ncbi:hypothetical protein [Stenotrophomonas geniculata]|uniref:hypothetical protein n=1 Tax=Stenotrophomonas geniculata TaxID=86188 RepID=UPI002E7A2879|nr:hypothetical protein [Stenotrophomonas geniculata]
MSNDNKTLAAALPDIESWSKGYKSGYARAVADLAARQPVGEPVGYSTFRDGRFGSWLFQTRVMAESHDSTAVAGGPADSEIVPLFRSPAQVVDLGQFRTKVAELLRSEFDLEVADPEYHRHDNGSGEADRIAGNIVALLGSQAVGNG